MADVLSLDAEVVSKAVNQIDGLVTEINQKITTLIGLLEETNKNSANTFTPVIASITKVTEAQRNVERVSQSITQINESLKAYEANFNAANDDSEFR